MQFQCRYAFYLFQCKIAHLKSKLNRKNKQTCDPKIDIVFFFDAVFLNSIDLKPIIKQRMNV